MTVDTECQYGQIGCDRIGLTLWRDGAVQDFRLAGRKCVARADWSYCEI